MSRLTSWLRGTSLSISTSDPSTPSIPPAQLLEQEMSDITSAFLATEHIMNDDLPLAHRLLTPPTSCYHHLSLSVLTFMQAILSFEKPLLTSAAQSLADCEERANADMKRMEREIPPELCGMYRPGSEYRLVVAEAQLMGAVVGVLFESVSEVVRGFLKLRKAYFTLEELAREEAETLEKVKAEKVKAEKEKTRKAREYDKKVAMAAAKDALASDIVTTTIEIPAPKVVPLSSPLHTPFPTTPLFPTPRAVFIHSGITLCFGILLFLFTLIPPSISRLLSIVGFHGDRPRGISLLWESTRFSNVHGAVAGLVLLNYYHGLLSVSDILLRGADVIGEENQEAGISYPRAKCGKLLTEMKQRYPDSGFWKLEEARLCSIKRDLPGALAVLQGDGPTPKMQQVSALLAFELSLDSLFSQNWDLTTKSFLAAMELNSWSHSMYYYLAGAAQLELYRDAMTARDAKEAAARKKKAAEYLGKVHEVSGRKRFMARQLPVEDFMERRLAVWEERVRKMMDAGVEVDMMDVIGVSPAMEMALVMNGMRRMDKGLIQKAMGVVAFDRLTGPAEVVKMVRGDPDEQAVQTVCMASYYRTLGDTGKAKETLAPLLAKDRAFFRGANRPDYILPLAHYELAVCLYDEACPEDADNGPVVPDGVSRDEFKKVKLAECKKELETTAGWEAFVLDANVGMRVQMGLETMKWLDKTGKI